MAQLEDFEAAFGRFHRGTVQAIRNLVTGSLERHNRVNCSLDPVGFFHGPDAQIHLEFDQITDNIADGSTLNHVWPERRAFRNVLKLDDFLNEMRGADQGIATVLRFRALMRGLAMNLDVVRADTLAGNLQITVQMWRLEDQHGTSTDGARLDDWTARVRSDLLVRGQQKFDSVAQLEAQFFQGFERPNCLDNAALHVIRAGTKNLITLDAPEVVPETTRVHRVGVSQQHHAITRAARNHYAQGIAQLVRNALTGPKRLKPGLYDIRDRIDARNVLGRALEPHQTFDVGKNGGRLRFEVIENCLHGGHHIGKEGRRGKR